MISKFDQIMDIYIDKHNFLKTIQEEISTAIKMIDKCYKDGNKLLVCGNGGSAADADHIVGELVKGFRKKRSLPDLEKELYLQFGEEGRELCERLQESLPAISLCAHTSLMTAIINDIGAEQIFAQQVMGYGNKGDVLIGISTSGNSANVIKAAITAKIKGLKTIGLTGNSGGRMNKLFDIVIHAPSDDTADIQDMHSVIYHLICTVIEADRW